MGRRKEDYHCNQCGRRLPNGKYTLCDECYGDLVKTNLLKKEEKKIEIPKRKTIRRKNKDNKIEIESLGGSTTDVTGSCFAVYYPTNEEYKGCFLIECGMIQGGTVLQDYNDNKKMISAIPYDIAEFILIGHPHVDHIGNICSSVPNGFKGKIYGSKETLAI